VSLFYVSVSNSWPSKIRYGCASQTAWAIVVAQFTSPQKVKKVAPPYAMQSSVLLATELGLPGYQLVYSGMVIELSHSQVPSRRVSVNEVQNGVSAIESKHISSKYTVYELQ
jgi:tryptophan synthase alpha subunit